MGMIQFIFGYDIIIIKLTLMKQTFFCVKKIQNIWFIIFNSLNTEKLQIDLTLFINMAATAVVVVLQTGLTILFFD